MMLKLLNVLLISLAWMLVASAPAANPRPALLVNYYSVPNTGDGSYSFIYELDDGTLRMERGEVRTTKDNTVYLAVTGSYSFTDDQGKPHRVEYSADEHGYRQHEVQEALAAFPRTRLSPAALGSLVGGGLG